jgi:hypothetical protein
MQLGFKPGKRKNFRCFVDFDIIRLIHSNEFFFFSLFKEKLVGLLSYSGKRGNFNLLSYKNFARGVVIRKIFYGRRSPSLGVLPGIGR